MNNIPPFNTIMPTLENLVEYFGQEIRILLRKEGGELTQIEGSETPTRTYIITYEHDAEFSDSIEAMTKDSVDDMLGKMLDNATKH